MWSNIRWDQDENQKHLPDTAHYVCAHCEYKIKESDKSRLLLGGEWRATEESNGGSRSKKSKPNSQPSRQANFSS